MKILSVLLARLQMIYSKSRCDLEEKRTEQVAKIGENIQNLPIPILTRYITVLVESYVHTGAKVAVLISIGSDSPEVSSNDQVISMAKDIVHAHCCYFSRLCSREMMFLQILLQKKRKLLRHKQKASLRKQFEKIVSGKLDKYYSGSCLLEQPFVKNPDQSIQQLVDSVGKEVGTTLRVEKFLRFQVGENA